MLVPDMVKLISEQLKVFITTTRLLVPTTSFVCKHFNPNWLFVFQFHDGRMWNILVNKQHHTAAMKVSVFPVYIVWARCREQFWSCNGAVNFCFLNSHNVRLVKIKEGQQFQFFASNAVDVYANKFQPTNKVIFTCAKCRRPCFLFFCQEINLFYL